MSAAHDAMDDTAEHATRGHGLAALPHCTGPCRGGRDPCTCPTGCVQPVAAPRPRFAAAGRMSPLAKLRRWWAAGKLRAELTAADADLAENELAQIALLHALRSLEPAAATPHRGKLQLLRCEALHLLRLRQQAEAALQALEAAP
ncbi:MAG: hypothetical protein ACK4F7_08185 [Inhella sp.]